MVKNANDTSLARPVNQGVHADPNPSIRFGRRFQAGVLDRRGESELWIWSAGWTTQRSEPRLAPDQPVRGVFKTRLTAARSKSAQENVIDIHSGTLFSWSDR